MLNNSNEKNEMCVIWTDDFQFFSLHCQYTEQLIIAWNAAGQFRLHSKEWPKESSTDLFNYNLNALRLESPGW